jgi:hypothetical protein
MKTTEPKHKHKWFAIPGLEAFPHRLCKCGVMHAPGGIKTGKRSLKVGVSGVGDVLRWSATKDAPALTDVGMDVAKGRVSTFFGSAVSYGAVTQDTIRWYLADYFENPNNANWIVNALAPAGADSVNAALNNRAFDDTAEEGVGLEERPEAGTTKLKIYTLSRAQTAPGAARTVGVKLYYRQIPNDAAVSTTWAGANDGSKVLNDIDIPANTNWQYDVQTLDLVSDFAPDLIAGVWHQFEMTRINPAAGTELVGDWDVLAIGVEWI